MKKYALGLDYGTNSVRAVLVEVATGEEIASTVWAYRRGEEGVIIDSRNPLLARQDPQDYLDGVREAVRGVLQQARKDGDFASENIIGVGVDTTGSTPLPVDADGNPLAFQSQFTDNPNAMAWLWKDHTSHAEAEEINQRARELKPHYLAKCGGTYSSEWYWAKAWHCLHVAPDVFDAAHTWIEIADWIPGVLTGTQHPDRLKRGRCAAGHKALFHDDWGGYPEEEFLEKLDPKLAALRRTLPNTAYTIEDAAGTLTPEWAEKLGVPAGIPVAIGAFDAHLGGVGSGIKPGILVKNVGTSTCDMMVAPLSFDMPDIPGLSGIVPGSILPGNYGLEAGQSAVGDIFNWFVGYMKPGGEKTGNHAELTNAAGALSPGESGLLALDWHNGNRTVLIDQRLTGLIMGLTLHTTPGEIYRALIEATAFGARIIMERFEEYGLTVERVINCGGIPAKNPLLMQIYADVMNREMEISRSTQTGALGSAIAGAVVAGADAGGYDGFHQAIDAMTGVLDTTYTPIPANVATYERLFGLYKRLHDVFGTKDYGENQYTVMKELIRIRDEVRNA